MPIWWCGNIFHGMRTNVRYGDDTPKLSHREFDPVNGARYRFQSLFDPDNAPRGYGSHGSVYEA